MEIGEKCDFLEVSAPKASESGFVGSSGSSDGPFGTDPSSSRAKYGPIMAKIRTNKKTNIGSKIYMDEYPWTVYFWHILIDRAHIIKGLAMTGMFFFVKFSFPLLS